VLSCIDCGDELPAERAGPGYRYCTKADRQALRHRGPAVTVLGVNESADAVTVGDSEETRRRGEAGEFGRKDSGLGLDYRPPAPASSEPAATGRREPVAAPRRPWSDQQETIVRLHHDMGLSPRRIAERARVNVPRLGITERLAVQIMSVAPRW
jgi:hypothetical protein